LEIVFNKKNIQVCTKTILPIVGETTVTKEIDYKTIKDLNITIKSITPILDKNVLKEIRLEVEIPRITIPKKIPEKVKLPRVKAKRVRLGFKEYEIIESKQSYSFKSMDSRAYHDISKERVEKVYNALREKAMTSRELMKRLKYSRTTLNRSIKILRLLGLVGIVGTRNKRKIYGVTSQKEGYRLSLVGSTYTLKSNDIIKVYEEPNRYIIRYQSREEGLTKEKFNDFIKRLKGSLLPRTYTKLYEDLRESMSHSTYYKCLLVALASKIIRVRPFKNETLIELV